jgi:hypothetical protein
MRPRVASRGHPIPTAEPNCSLTAGGEMALPRSTASASTPQLWRAPLSTTPHHLPRLPLPSRLCRPRRPASPCGDKLPTACVSRVAQLAVGASFQSFPSSPSQNACLCISGRRAPPRLPTTKVELCLHAPATTFTRPGIRWLSGGRAFPRRSPSPSRSAWEFVSLGPADSWNGVLAACAESGDGFSLQCLVSPTWIAIANLTTPVAAALRRPFVYRTSKLTYRQMYRQVVQPIDREAVYNLFSALHVV